jgi:hypothetical protein
MIEGGLLVKANVDPVIDVKRNDHTRRHSGNRSAVIRNPVF